MGGYQFTIQEGGHSESSGRGRIGQQFNGFGGWFQARDWDTIRLDRSLAPDDIPHIFNTASAYELPVGPGKALLGHTTGVARLLTQGYKTSINFNVQSGIPGWIGGPCTSLQYMEWFFTQYIGTCPPNLIGNPSAGQGSKNRAQLEQQYWNPNAFQAPFGSDRAIIALATTGTPAQKDQHNEFWRFGTAGYTLGNARQPGFWGADAAVSKDFKFTETKYLQLQFEVYNLLDHMNLGIPSNKWCLHPNPDGSTDAVHSFGCSFGKITSIQTDPRAMQFGLKFVF